ncbi:hypothetical protein GY45DRAFT_1236516, partial [Cubamyces sp. BRFM 1775]
VFLGHEWIRHHNPRIDWQTKTIDFSRCPDTCEHVLEEGERVFALQTQMYLKRRAEHLRNVQLRARSTIATDIAIEQNRDRPGRTFEELVPEFYRDYADVFSESTFDQLPE